MRSKLLRRALGSSLIVSLLGLAPVTGSTASEDLETVVWMATDRHGLEGPELSNTFLPGDAEVSVLGDASELVVAVGDVERPEPALTFAAPVGERLSERRYDHTLDAEQGRGERAGFHISGTGDGGWAWWCGPGIGAFTVKRIVVEPDGSVSSLWIVFEHHCDEWPPSQVGVIGEVRYRVPGDGGTAIVSAREVDWGKADRTQPMHLVPVRVLNPSAEPVVLGTPALEGTGAAFFKMNAKDCRDKTLAPGERCTVWLRFTTAATGPRAAALVIPEASGTAHRTSLAGSVYDGTTRFVLSSHPDDYVGDGRFYDFKPANARFSINGSERGIELMLHGEHHGSDQYWSLVIAAPDGEVLQPGRRYTNAPYPAGAPGQYDGWGFAVWGDHRLCDPVVSEFTVSELEIDEFGDVARFGVSFVQRCKSGRPAGHMKGLLDFRAERAHSLPKPPPRFHDRLLIVMHHRTYIDGGFALELQPTREACWFRVPIHVYHRYDDRLLGRLRTDRNGSFRWKTPPPLEDGQRVPLVVVAPVKYLSGGWVCAKAEQYPT